MNRLFQNLVNEPPKEDSKDLTDEELAQVIPTSSSEELAKIIVEELRCGGLTIKSHELRRRGEDLFWRTHLVVAPTEPERVLLFRVNWLGGG
jgi:hypothetical protein